MFGFPRLKNPSSKTPFGETMVLPKLRDWDCEMDDVSAAMETTREETNSI